jgi:hypothetical protein
MPRTHRIATLILLAATSARADPKPDLEKLRSELRALPYDAAAKQLTHFRPLCDADGYPLVGNISTKGDGDKMQPSTLCKLVREQKAKPTP